MAMTGLKIMLIGSLTVGVSLTGLAGVGIYQALMSGGKETKVDESHYIKLKPILVPYKKKNASKSGYIFTAVFLKIKDPKSIRKTCRLEPRFQDKLMQFFHKNPIKNFYYQDIGKEKTRFLSSIKREKKLLKSIKSIKGSGTIKAVKMMKDNRSFKTRNSSKFPLPFIACEEVDG